MQASPSSHHSRTTTLQGPQGDLAAVAWVGAWAEALPSMGEGAWEEGVWVGVGVPHSTGVVVVVRKGVGTRVGRVVVGAGVEHKQAVVVGAGVEVAVVVGMVSSSSRVGMVGGHRWGVGMVVHPRVEGTGALQGVGLGGHLRVGVGMEEGTVAHLSSSSRVGLVGRHLGSSSSTISNHSTLGSCEAQGGMPSMLFLLLLLLLMLWWQGCVAAAGQSSWKAVVAGMVQL